MNCDLVIRIGKIQGDLLLAAMAMMILLDTVLIWQRYRLRKLMEQFRARKGR
jgi:hypothetical protein